MKIFSAITLSSFMILNIYDKHKWHTGKARDFSFIRMRARPNFSSFLTWTIVLTGRYCMAASDQQLIQTNQQKSALLIKLSTIYIVYHTVSTRHYVRNTSNIEAQFSDEYFQEWNEEWRWPVSVINKDE